MPTRFVTIVPHIENLELRKDTGQIPYQMHKHQGFASTIVSYYYSLTGGRKEGPCPPPDSKKEIEDNYPYFLTEVPGLKISFLANKGRGKFYEKAIYEYIKQEAKNIDVLNLFHFNSQNIFYILIYKLKNPQGKVYLKLDIDIAFYQKQKSIFNIDGKLGRFKDFFYNRFLLPYVFKKIDLLSAEHFAGVDYFTRRFNLKAGKVKLIPNGVDLDRILSLMGRLKTFDEKENIILTVGRIGNIQKNHELLLQIIPDLDLSDWKFYFAGPIEPEFHPKIERFFFKNPSLVDKVMFCGNISDPTLLYDLYNRSKIFCMPSRWEGSPLAAAEAAVFGNILILGEAVFAYDTLTENGNWGFKVNEENIRVTLTDLLINSHKQKRLIEGLANYAKKTFTWEPIVNNINKELFDPTTIN